MKKVISLIFVFFFTLNTFAKTDKNCNSLLSENLPTAYTLTINATNGSVLKLLEDDIIDQDVFEENTTIRLITRPAVGYKFSHWTGDISGNRLIADITMTGNKTVTAVYEVWEPATGIPVPEFGVFENYRMYDAVANRNPELTYNQNTEGGYYTHYIDNTDPNATNSNNNYGSLAVPRTSLPSASNIPPGSVIEYHGVSYPRGYTVLALTGTVERPIFIRGASADQRVTFSGNTPFYMNSAYVIMENLEFEMSLTVRSYNIKQAHHVAVRNCNTKALSALSWEDGESSEDIVFYCNYNNSNAFDPADGTFSEADSMGIGINGNSNGIWIIDNIITRAGGDAVGNGHAANYTAKNYYVGRNIMYTCGENAIDIKEVDKVIVSENVMFDYNGWSSGSDGSAMVMHYGPTLSPKNVWILNNEIFECTSTGIQVGGDQVHDVYIIGNLIHDIHNDSNTAKGYISWSSQMVYMINNTFFNIDNGINSSISNPTATLFAVNNIVSNVSPNGYHMSIGGSAHMSNSVFENNLFYQPDGISNIEWGSNSYTLSQFMTNTSKGAGSIEAYPLFENSENINFRLQSNSPAIDAGIEHSTYQLYETLYGLNIKNDANGVVKPNGDHFDIGAYEFDFSNSDPLSNSSFVNSDINMYPNPVIDILVLENMSNVKDISIFNVTGQLIKSVSNLNNTINLDVSQLITGVYFIKFNTANGVSTKTLIKK